MRWLWPVLMFAMTGWVAYYNQSHTDRQVMFPFVDVLFPEIDKDPIAMGWRSVQLLFGVSVAFTLFTLVEQIRAFGRARRRRQEQDGG